MGTHNKIKQSNLLTILLQFDCSKKRWRWW